MDSIDINLRALKVAVNNVLDHVIEELSLEEVAIEPTEDYYWECPAPGRYDTTKQADPAVGRLTDDMEFCRLIKSANNGVASYNLVHIAPLLQYIGEKIRR